LATSRRTSARSLTDSLVGTPWDFLISSVSCLRSSGGRRFQCLRSVIASSKTINQGIARTRARDESDGIDRIVLGQAGDQARPAIVSDDLSVILGLMSRAAAMIREARIQAGLTQAELAAQLGLSQSAIAKLERAGSNPTVERLDRTLRATGHRLQLIAPAWSTATGEPGPSIDLSLVRRHLEQTPGQRIAGLEQMYAETAMIASAAARARDETA